VYCNSEGKVLQAKYRPVEVLLECLPHDLRIIRN
jgi:hypothetical protein